MATGTSSYQRSVERAKAAGFSSPYAQRKARDAEQGTTPRKKLAANRAKRGVKRDYALEKERLDIRARAQGFTDAKARTKFNRTNKDREAQGLDPFKPEKFQMAATLAQFGISKATFDRYRRENRAWNQPDHDDDRTRARDINTYVVDFDPLRPFTPFDSDIHNWSPDRVGYVVYFNRAIVNPKSNYQSLLDDKGNRKYKGKGKNRKPVSNQDNFYYLVKYTNLFQQSEFEARYA